MKKTNLIKIFLVIIVSIMLAITTTSTFAAEDTSGLTIVQTLIILQIVV